MGTKSSPGHTSGSFANLQPCHPWYRLTSSTLFVNRSFQRKCKRPSSPFCNMIAPFVGLGSIEFDPSRLNARPALKARRSVIRVENNVVGDRDAYTKAWENCSACSFRTSRPAACSSLKLMSFAGFDDPTAWGAPSDAPSGDIVKDAVRKEQILKSVCSRCYAH
jgi:hypothetical protein